MPRDPMPNHPIRVGADLWNKAKERAAVNTEPRKVTVPLDGNENLSEAIRKFLEKYVR